MKTCFLLQVVNTIQAEMISDIRNYDPSDSDHSVTRAWDMTQTQLHCCGVLTEKYPEPWMMWTSNKLLNPSSEYQVVPQSCCVTGHQCVTADNKTNVDMIWPGDCMELSLVYVRDHALTLAIANITVCCFLVCIHIQFVANKLEYPYPTMVYSSKHE